MATRVLTIRQFWKIKWTRRKERIYPWIVALFVGILTFTLKQFTQFCPSDDTLLRVLGASVIFGSITAGFVGTSLAVMSGTGREFKKRLTRSKYIYDFQSYLGAGLYSGMTLALVGILGPVVVEYDSVGIVFVVWATALSFCICCQIRVCRIMLIILADTDTH